MNKKKEKILICKYCKQTAERLILLALMMKCGGSVHPPPNYCPYSPNHEHEFIYIEKSGSK